MKQTDKFGWFFKLDGSVTRKEKQSGTLSQTVPQLPEVQCNLLEGECTERRNP